MTLVMTSPNNTIIPKLTYYVKLVNVAIIMNKIIMSDMLSFQRKHKEICIYKKSPDFNFANLH